MKQLLQMPVAVKRIIEQLNRAGYEAYAVGGCVRDSILGKEPQDWDITTSARPEQVKAIFGRTIDTGIAHGTVTIIRDKIGYEVTTYRIDGEYLDSRHPSEVEYTVNLVEDLKRRDFTINAMAYHHQTGLVDVFNGIDDMNNKWIRCVGNPLDRFREDALRILRAIRFSAQLGFAIQSDTLQAIRQIGINLRNISKERIQSELTKLLLSTHPAAVSIVRDTEIDQYITDHFKQVFYQPILLSDRYPRKKAIRWAGLLYHLNEAQVETILRELKMDHNTIDRVKLLIRWQNEPFESDEIKIRKVMSQMSEEEYRDLIDYKRCGENDQENSKIKAVWKLAQVIRERGDCLYLSDLAINGTDLIKLGIRPGKEIGKQLQRLLLLVLEHPENNTKECLIKQIL